MASSDWDPGENDVRQDSRDGRLDELVFTPRSAAVTTGLTLRHDGRAVSAFDRSAGLAAIRKVAVLGNHVPRRCGIATFTTDLTEALSAEFAALECFVIAMNDPGQHHAYPARVRFEVAERDTAAYRRAADFLNVNAVDVLSVQHEYGIFGGKAGSHVLQLLHELRMPVVTTLHTILAAPDPHQRRAMGELTSLSARLVVMSAHGAELLREVHGVPADKIDLIPHGIPTRPPDPHAKDQLGVEGRPVLLTFGLLGPDKGIEHVIDALPAIRARFPEVLYIVVGVTHPHIKERYGETYRLALENRAHQLGVDSNVMFHNRFVSQGELVDFLAAADIYITPYLKAEQITSGTLAYAVGSGKAVISTPYQYATELLGDGRGVLVPWRDAAAVAREVVGLLGDDARRRAMQARAAAYGANMGWPAVARQYVQVFARARREHAERLRTSFRARTLATRPAELPELDLAHLRLMTDGTGLLQHAIFDVPRYDDGYCLDDNARALLLMAQLQEAGLADGPTVRALASRYLAFVSHAFDRDTGRFRNQMDYSRQWREDCGSEDSHGRALWALGTVVGRGSDPGRQGLGGSLFLAALPASTAFSSPRAWAFALLGIDEYLRAFEGDSNVEAVGRALAARLLELYQRTGTPDWPWFESSVTYCNARLPQALLVAGTRSAHEEMTAVGLQSLTWLCSIQRSPDGHFAPIGSNGFYVRGGVRSAFDQQPVEACATIAACLEAQRCTGDAQWAERARAAFNWFLGQNQLQQMLYDPLTGGCRDGLHADRVNENQGAESTLSLLLSLLALRTAERSSLDTRTGGGATA